MNHVSLVGRISKEPELRYTTEGKAVLGFTLATDEPEINGKDRTNFVKVVIFGSSAEKHAKHMTKGLLISLQGRLNVRQVERTLGGQVYKLDETNVIPDSIRYLETRAQVDERQRRKMQTASNAWGQYL